MLKAEVSEILHKGVIHIVPAKYQFLRNLFLVEKKDQMNSCNKPETVYDQLVQNRGFTHTKVCNTNGRLSLQDRPKKWKGKKLANHQRF